MDLTLNSLRQRVKQLDYRTLKAGCLQLLTQHPSDPALYPLLALAYLHLGERPAAETQLELALTHRNTLDADALIDLGAVYMLLFQLEPAIDVLEQALSLQPKHALGLARLGWCRLQQDDLATALALLSSSDRLESRQVPVLIHLAQVYLLQSDYVSAQFVIEQALQQLLQNPSDYSPQAFQHYQQQLAHHQLKLWVADAQFAAAEHWLGQQKTAGSDTVYHAWLIQYAQLLAEQNLHAQAEEALRDGLKTAPDNISLMMQLAELAQVQGHFMQAIMILKRAIKQEQDHVGLWLKLSSACLHRLDHESRQAAEKAVSLADALIESEDYPLPLIRQLKAQAKNALAMVENDAQHYDIAETLFREVLAEFPHFIPALQGLGQQQMQRGQIDEALALFERMKGIDLVKGTTSLINARHFPDDDEILKKLEKAAKSPSLEGPVRAGILFQLAAVWEKRQVYDKAFDFAKQANTASRAFLTYDGKAHRQHCARIRIGFCQALFEHRPHYGIDSTVPVYVLGMPRSGTTLVEQIIAGHSDIFGAGELSVIPNLVQGLNRWERHVGSGRGYPDCIDDLTRYVTQGIANNILKELQEYAPEAKHIVDKLPHNFENIGLIKFFFPYAKIISVRRDPRDIALSNYFTDYQAKHGGMGFAYDLTDIGQQLADHNLLMRHWHQLFPDEILEIHYEDVVEDLEGSARKLLAYIGVDWQPEVLRFNELERPVKTASVWQVRQPIYQSSKFRWMHYQAFLAPLIKGTNAPIEWESIDMITLPEPGFLTEGVALFKQGNLDAAELSFKKMLYHNPEHAACHYLVGLVYLNKGHMQEGIAHIEKALEKTPWHREWRESLIRAYEATGQMDKAVELKNRHKHNNLQTEEIQDNAGVSVFTRSGNLESPNLAKVADSEIDALLNNYFNH